MSLLYNSGSYKRFSALAVPDLVLPRSVFVDKWLFYK